MSLARQVLRNQIRVRGGGSFGGHAWEHIRRKVLKKMHSGDCTAPLNRRGPDGSYPMTTRLKRRGEEMRRIFKPGTKWADVGFFPCGYDPYEGVR